MCCASPLWGSQFVNVPFYSRPAADAEGVALPEGEKFFGMVNFSNTCYANSVLQCLYFCAPFRRRVIQGLGEDSSDSLLGSLAELFAKIENQKRAAGYVVPRRFISRLRRENELFSTCEHQDAHEFLQYLLNNIAETLVAKQKQQDPAFDPNKPPQTWVHDIFQGFLVNQTKCLCCENITVRREPFLNLSVDIEEHTSIAACLRAFESTELLRSNNKFFCDSCACLQEAEKRLRICQLPSVLTLHLKRFKFDEKLGRCCRLPYRVVFPLQLRVVEHQHPGSVGLRAASSAGARGGTDDADPDRKPSGRLYELRGVVVHIGRDPSRGHYVAIVKSQDRWVLLDDEVVKVVEPELLRSFYGSAGPRDVSASGGWGGGSSASESHMGRQHTSGYNRMPQEGTCCGYLLVYEQVAEVNGQNGIRSDDQPLTPGSVGSYIDWGSCPQDLVDWPPEDDGLDSSSDSDSGSEHHGHGARQTDPNDDGETTQAFEQRCYPRLYAANGPRAVPHSFGRPGGPAGRIPPGNGHGMGLGAVVPAASTPGTVSPSHVGVGTMSPSASLGTLPGGAKAD